MFALGIRYLNGWAMAAADGAKKERAEWPPHPDRVFMALAAAFFEGERRPAHRAALEWLEQLSPPAIVASDYVQRETVTHYVPINDASSPTIHLDNIAAASPTQVHAALALLPENRLRQPRQFPVAIPENDTVQLVWRDTDVPDTHRDALAELCTQVTCVGHSASLVQMWLADRAASPTWCPVESGPPDRRFRVLSRGRLNALETAFNESQRLSWLQMERAIKQAKGKEKAVLKAALKQHFDGRPPLIRRPPGGLWAGYESVRAESIKVAAASTIFSERLLIFRQISGRRLSLESALLLTQTVRDYVLKMCPVQSPPEWISGHTNDGKPSSDPHLAAFPLAHVGHEYAQGHLLGFALAVPRGIAPAEIGRCLSPLFELDDQGAPAPFKLYSGDRFEATFQFDLADEAPRTLKAETWVATASGAMTWASVTPIVLDRHGKSGDPWREAEETIKLACERIGLIGPRRPISVEIGPVSHFVGAPSASGKRGGYPHLLRKDGSRRHQVHAVLTFAQPVQGPLLIGAGRFRGYGLCRPWPAYEGRQT